MLVAQQSPPVYEASKPADMLAEVETSLPGTLFHEHWWLAATTNGRFREVTVHRGDRVVGRLPFVMKRKLGFVVCAMPPFTHLLGPVVDAGKGKPQSRLLQRMSIVRDLVGQLPPFDSFLHALDASAVDGLAFQEHGFQVSAQYTFEIDCRAALDDLWNGMHTKTRQHIRRAEEKFSVDEIDDPQEFVHFYLRNLNKRGVASDIDFETFPDIFAQARARDSGEILCARWPDGRATAMTFIVWGHGRMYYLLSTRAKDAGDNGSVNLLIWTAIKRARDRGLVLDLDGVSTVGTARFLSGFNGSIKLRMIARRTGFLFGAMQLAKRQLIGYRARETASFT